MLSVNKQPFKTNWELQKTESCLVHIAFLTSKVFKTTSNVLNFDKNIVNIALIAFCSLVVAKLAHWLMSSKLLCGSLANSFLWLLFVLALL